jgi:hypothetical protein
MPRVSDPFEDADYATRAYLQELGELRSGQARHSGSALVTIRVARDSRHHAIIYNEDADDGDRAVVVVPLEVDPGFSSFPDATAATFYGTLRPGHAVALEMGERLYFPAGPSFKPGPLVLRFRASTTPSWAATLPGYLNDPRRWKTRSVLPTFAAIGAVSAVASQSLAGLLVCVAALTWFRVVYRRWRSTSDPFDDGSGPVEW